MESAEDEDVAEDDAETPPAMLTILELDTEAPGSVDPELAASICGMDRDLILELITWNSEQEIAWRQARDAALLACDPDDEADVGDHEMQHAARMMSLLRRALRVVVERELGEPSRASDPVRRTGDGDPTYLSVRSSRGLDEVDPEARA